MKEKIVEKESYKILEIDPWLKPFEKDIRLRMNRYNTTKKAMLGDKTLIKDVANGHLYYGFHRTNEGWFYREWAPAAEALFLVGDFNFWNPYANPLYRKDNGDWEIFLPGTESLTHLSRVKVRVRANGQEMDRIPLYIRRTVQDSNTHDFSGQIWNPENQFQWTDGEYKRDKDSAILIYEAHVGMAQEKEAMGTFREFRDIVLPKVKELGYNTVQLMAIMDHPYYASFGYQVSSFFAVASWFGTPDDLKDLINTAHSMGIAVLIDLVHSHAIKNTVEGMDKFDGTDYQFFHSGKKGHHPAWDSRLFDYGKHKVMHFLLSNIKFWLEEYHFDGFRFDGVTSMLYHHKGLGVAFSDYKKYFSMDTDLESVTYLQLANELIKEVKSDAVSIAEDMSGMPGMCIPILDGGIGFDYRLSMGVPDFWIKTLKFVHDENWSMGNLWQELTTRRPQEKTIGYAESHDQALVGDKTIVFWLADKEMYWHMTEKDDNIVISRAVALHKLIRFISLTLSGDGYLNFMGNEFGHPEWIDFPRQGNGWSYKYARRQWSLSDRPDLKYKFLLNFDKEMLAFVKQYKVLEAADGQSMWIDEKNKLLTFKKAGLIFLFNFNPNKSFTEYPMVTGEDGKYRVVFDSDQNTFGGQERIDRNMEYNTISLPSRAKSKGVLIYSPSRTVLVLKKV